MCADDRASNGQAEAKTGCIIHVACAVAAHERFQDFALVRIRDSWAVILDVDGDAFVRRAQANGGLVAEAHGVLHEIGDAAMQVVRPDHRQDMRGTGILHAVAHVRKLISDDLQRGCDVAQCRRRKPAVVAQKGQHLLQH